MEEFLGFININASSLFWRATSGKALPSILGLVFKPGTRTSSMVRLLRLVYAGASRMHAGAP